MLTIVAGIVFVHTVIIIGSATNSHGNSNITAPAPLTPEEQQQQERLQSIIAATTRNLAQGQKEIDGLVYTPRWSNPVWVEPDSLSIPFVYCLPGEFADSGQHILGGSELEVLESYSLAVNSDLTGWLMVVENEGENARLLAAVGVICSSDANVAETHVVSPEEQTEISNVIQQFITIRTMQISNINQVTNIINNVTTNGTGTTPTNDTGGVEPEPLGVLANWDSTDGDTAPATYRMEADATGEHSCLTPGTGISVTAKRPVWKTLSTHTRIRSYNATATIRLLQVKLNLTVQQSSVLTSTKGR